MKELSITNLAKILNASADAEHRVQDAGQNVTSVSTDSRTVTLGDCFFAITGPNFDGHNFLADAFAKGAVCAVVSKAASISNQQSAISNKVILKVDDTVKSLGVLAAWYRKDCNFKVIAITGSVGKTTAREIIYHVLSAVGETSPMGGSNRFKTFQSPKNFNNFIGLPLTLLAAEPDCQIVIAELGTNHPGEIEYLSRIASPDIAIITNVHPAHLAGFGTIEKIAEEKLAIVKGLCPKGILIINSDCRFLLDCARRLKLTFRKFSCFDDDADYHTDNLIVGPLASRFTIDNAVIEIPLPGWGNVENALAAWSICSTLGLSIRDFAEAVKTISPVSMRSELLKIGSLTVISDCYNANPASMKNAIEILTNLAAHQKRRAVFVCGDMAELGNQTEKFHTELGRLITSSNVNLLLTVGHLALLAADTARHGDLSGVALAKTEAQRSRAKNESPTLETHSFTQSDMLCDNLHKLIKDSDIILVKGSRINKLETVVEKLKAIYPGP
jgi:UDP-N-acetylmuramoyl-tripeptide--D-alanyl-D-alanine ligase